MSAERFRRHHRVHLGRFACQDPEGLERAGVAAPLKRRLRLRAPVEGVVRRPVTVYTYTVKRTQIFLSDDELAALGKASRATGRTKSDLVREAIDRVYLKGVEQQKLMRALRASQGSWARREDGRATVDRIRSGRLARIHQGAAK